MSLAVHNVVQLSDAEVLSRFVVRQAELDALMAHLREPDPPRHALVVGPRGMGKSLLLRRVAIAVASDPELAARWLPLVMAEELYEVTSAGELWLAALARMADVVGDRELLAQRQALLAERDPSRLETRALQRLLAAAQGRGQKVLLLAENLDMLLGEQMSSDENWSLRTTLQTEPDLLLMASAVTKFAPSEDGEEAFYGFFHGVDLRPLDDTDVSKLWLALTGVELPQARALAVRILTGGNPRLITVLARFTRNPDLSGLRQDLELLIDEYTPFFKANIEALPPIERKVFVTLADIWAPATAAEVAEQARMDTNKVSSLLSRLVRRGTVEVVDSYDSKRRYELTERLYNLYHLLRRPGDDGRVRALVDILVHLYEPGELRRDVWPHIVIPPPGAESQLDVPIASRLHRYLDDAGVWDDLAAADRVANLPVFESLLAAQRASLGDDHPDTLLTRYQIAYCHGRADPQKALQLSREVLANQQRVLGPDHPDTLSSRYHVAYYTGETGRAEEALALYREVAADSARALGPDHPDTLASRHQVAYYTGRTGRAEEALALYREVAADSARALGPDHPDTLASRHQVAYYTGETGGAEEALALCREVAADRARVLGPDHRETLRSRHQVAYYTGETGDARAALAMEEEVLRMAEAALGDKDELVIAARWLKNLLTLRMDTGSGKPLPRELRELQAATPPPPTRERRRRRSGPRPGP